jgi:AhpD family alkylhydroperoxidase
MDTPRIKPGTQKEIGLLATLLSKAIAKQTKTKTANIFTTIAKSKTLFWFWLLFASRLMPFGKLKRSETELVILTVAHIRDCKYELTHHLKLAKSLGLNNEILKFFETEGQSIANSKIKDYLNERESVLFDSTIKILKSRVLNDAEFFKLKSQLSEKQIIEFLMLVGHYDMLATLLLNLKVDLDE